MAPRRISKALAQPVPRPLLFLLVGVIFRMMLGGLLGMMHGLKVMTVRYVRMMAGAHMFTGFVMLGGLLMVFGGLLVMLAAALRWCSAPSCLAIDFLL